jgi:hypothetical protein
VLDPKENATSTIKEGFDVVIFLYITGLAISYTRSGNKIT